MTEPKQPQAVDLETIAELWQTAALRKAEQAEQKLIKSGTKAG